ncbi:hypothetical protein BKG82_26575 [Mycobacteroides chelonae]|uniref:ESX-1 secretion-associated protein n=1 Tax=Mycobacteroides chelonae TaxID=1774 RepID=A0A1S1LC55_MYCCH|nr:hypothetical protein [Mycobacteroides chelonae]OHU47223.1 hypothetical protein BKG82_26575 [Mycobacteroides chelonae]
MTGEHNAGGGQQISANPDNLRAFGNQLNGELAKMDSFAALANEVVETARREASEGTVDHNPSGMISPAVQSLELVRDKIVNAVKQVRQNFENDANEAIKLANDIDAQQDHDSAKIKGIGK